MLLCKIFNLTLEVGVPWDLIENYTKDSTIHGVKYVGEKKQHWSVKIFWITIFTISLFFCVKNMIEVYKIRQERPVQISFSKKLTPLFEIPFASVTICPEMKTKCDKVNLNEILNRKNFNYSSEEVQNIFALNHVCESHLFDEEVKRITKYKESNLTEQFNVVEKLNELSHSYDEMFFQCRFGTLENEDCRKYFHKIITDVGICYSFNMLDKKDLIENDKMHVDLQFPSHGKSTDWFLAKDYKKMEIDVYPHRVPGAGLQSGLSIQFKVNASMFCSNCLHSAQGFRVALHMPVELPSMSKHFYYIPFRRQTNIIVKPNMIYPSKDIKDYKPKSRQCYYGDERKLKFYKIYTKNFCEMECKSDYIFSQCGCVKFSMPRTNVTNVCNSTQLECVYQAEKNYIDRDLQITLLEKQLKRDVKHGKTNKKDKRYYELKKLDSCNCLASCTNIKYDVEISQTDYDFTEDGFLTAKLNVYYKDYYFTRLKRYEIYGWTDFISNTGGIFGLFMGCSLLSFIEIIYHVIFYCIKRIRNRINPEIIPS